MIRLKSMRKKAGLTQSDLAFLLAKEDETAISKLELRKSNLTVRNLLACCLIFDCTPEEMLPELHLELVEELEALVHALKSLKQKDVSARTTNRIRSLNQLLVRIDNFKNSE